LLTTTTTRELAYTRARWVVAEKGRLASITLTGGLRGRMGKAFERGNQTRLCQVEFLLKVYESGRVRDEVEERKRMMECTPRSYAQRTTGWERIKKKRL
jgi:outer membrane protein TolC